MKRLWRKWRLIGIVILFAILAVGIVWVVDPDRPRIVWERGTEMVGDLWVRFFGNPTDPSDEWFYAFTVLQEGERAEKAGDHPVALAKFQDSKKRFDRLRRQHPAFHPDLVRFRRKSLEKSIRDLELRLRSVVP